jgi:hypothetical protein
MTTYSDVIRDALGKIGVLDETEQPSAEQANTGLRALTAMLDDWETRGIDVGFASGSELNDTVSIDDDAIRAVTLSLAVELCPDFEREPPPRLLNLADNAFRRLLRDAMNDQLPEANMAHMPRGSGWPADIDLDDLS